MGHVNNAVYLSYLESARFAWWRRALGPSGLSDHSFIVARVEIDYRKPALPGERLLVRLRVDGLGRSSFTIAYEILNMRTREVVADARSVQVAYDYTLGKSVPLSEDLRAKLEASC
jgi:YbgC/YbaW family acyl-CoA thioester hydrolase